MKSFSITASDGHDIACYGWVPDSPTAVIQIAHGMGEHAQRYDWVADQLTEQGYAVYASDHRGHGGTSGPMPGYMGPDGWNRNLADMFEINQYIRQQHRQQKFCLLGHSMGSMLSQQYITRYGPSIDALVLSGSPGFKDSKFSFINRWILAFEKWRLGADQSSEMLQKALFQANNKPFDGPGVSGYEWLSRDAAEVQKYVDDPQCGFVLSVGSLSDMFQGSALTQSKSSISKIPLELPMYIFSGSEDPVHGEKADIERMVNAYRLHGIGTLDYQLYSGGRHEMFNESNKQEVIADLCSWLNRHL